MIFHVLGGLMIAGFFIGVFAVSADSVREAVAGMAFVVGAFAFVFLALALLTGTIP